MKSQLYLSGSIEFNKDPDTWREKMFHALKRKYKVLIPWEDDPPAKKGTPEYRNWIFENFITPDMSDVARCKYIFVRLDKGVFKGAGTISELALAAWLNKHIVVMLDGIKEEDIPGWTCGCLRDAVFVKTVDEAIEYYKELVDVITDRNG